MCLGTRVLIVPFMELKVARLKQRNDFVFVLIVPFMELKDFDALGYEVLNKSLNRTFYGIETELSLGT